MSTHQTGQEKPQPSVLEPIGAQNVEHSTRKQANTNTPTVKDPLMGTPEHISDVPAGFSSTSQPTNEHSPKTLKNNLALRNDKALHKDKGEVADNHNTTNKPVKPELQQKNSNHMEVQSQQSTEQLPLDSEQETNVVEVPPDPKSIVSSTRSPSTTSQDKILQTSTHKMQKQPFAEPVEKPVDLSHSVKMKIAMQDLNAKVEDLQQSFFATLARLPQRERIQLSVDKSQFFVRCSFLGHSCNLT